ncbi:RNase adapter RapZ [Pseudohongiella spirulinae]|uniref:GlmZ(SRNA)-inactivating NTPase n=1 Tax=Pseudohongiella spirulinae TaxID=1249552 RepID=A0A0S2KF65_9GAMM|nr:RNase adapter RapZ [Pseudohongiella spirulinae]ALO46972.1 glmZ(sRNA)-inactivating NTPase [Pseudohongiella spirulinae]
MKLLIISGRSGSGKSTALNMLEDSGYYCIDNLPASLLPAFIQRISHEQQELPRVAVSIDARNIPDDLKKVPDILRNLQESSLNPEVIFLDASSPVLIRRFSESRRRHPLTTDSIGLREAINKERELLEPIATLAGLSIDTSSMSVHQLRELVRSRILERKNASLSVMFESFGFKNGVPVDADLVFDARCLPNPYWDASLRHLTGKDAAVVSFLSSHPDVEAMLTDITQYLQRWLPSYEASNRSYMTVAIGCTGGQHRSVYLCERLYGEFSDKISNLQLLHRELSRPATGKVQHD